MIYNYKGHLYIHVHVVNVMYHYHIYYTNIFHYSSLPPYIVVPYNISDDTLEYAASLHKDNRLPVS